jgi:hypothetical protein
MCEVRIVEVSFHIAIVDAIAGVIAGLLVCVRHQGQLGVG